MAQAPCMMPSSWPLSAVNNNPPPLRNDLLRLHTDYGTQFDAIHISVFWNRIKQLAGSVRSLERVSLRMPLRTEPRPLRIVESACVSLCACTSLVLLY